MTPTNQYNKLIIDRLGLKAVGIRAHQVSIGIALNRDDCHNSPLFKDMQEPEIINGIPKLIKELVDDDPGIRVIIYGKTDDEWFIEILAVSE